MFEDFDVCYFVYGLIVLFLVFVLCWCLDFGKFLEYQRGWKMVVYLVFCGWFEDLYIVGIDLEEYGKVIKVVFVDIGILQFRVWLVELICLLVQLEFGYVWKDIIYGLYFGDWLFVFEQDIVWEDFLRDFWEWIENFFMNIFGFWIYQILILVEDQCF